MAAANTTATTPREGSSSSSSSRVWLRRAFLALAYAYLPIHVYMSMSTYLEQNLDSTLLDTTANQLKDILDWQSSSSSSTTTEKEEDQTVVGVEPQADVTNKSDSSLDAITTTTTTMSTSMRRASSSTNDAAGTEQARPSSSTNDATSTEQADSTTTTTTATTTTTTTTSIDMSQHPYFSHQPPPTSRFAYAFVVGGIHESKHAYKGFLYDVLVATRILRRRLQSSTDVWVFCQLSPNSTLDKLPEEDRMLLFHSQLANVYVEELPKPTHESFAQLVYHKFRLLQMTQYERVMFLDADVIPLSNLEYLFELSVQGDNDEKDQSDSDQSDRPNNNNSSSTDSNQTTPITPPPFSLRPNLVLATRGEPCNTGVFMVAPKPGDWDRLQAIIDRQHEQALRLPYPHFDWNRGWGHSFRETGDKWEGTVKNGNHWRFHAGHSDQGLMYYWAKYVQQDVSIAIGNRLQNWVPSNPNRTGMPRLFHEYVGVLDQHNVPNGTTNRLIRIGSNCFPKSSRTDFRCFAPYRDFQHFMGNKKPWQQTMNDRIRYHSHYGLWFDELVALSQELGRPHWLNVTHENWNDVHLPLMKESPLGYIATHKDRAEMINGGHHPTKVNHTNNIKKTTAKDTAQKR